MVFPALRASVVKPAFVFGAVQLSGEESKLITRATGSETAASRPGAGSSLPSLRVCFPAPLRHVGAGRGQAKRV
jgi:hypothetical protein